MCIRDRTKPVQESDEECKYDCDSDDAKSSDWSDSANIPKEAKEYIGKITDSVLRLRDKTRNKAFRKAVVDTCLRKPRLCPNQTILK